MVKYAWIIANNNIKLLRFFQAGESVVNVNGIIKWSYDFFSNDNFNNKSFVTDEKKIGLDYYLPSREQELTVESGK